MPHWDTPVRHYRAKPSPPSPHARRRRRIATASPAPQRGYHGATTRLLRELLRSYYKATTRLLRGYYEATTRPLTTYQAITRLLPRHYQATTRLPRDYYQEPPARHSASSSAQQRQHRSPAGAAHASNLEPRRRRDPSAHQWKDLEEAVRSPHAEQAGQLIFILSYPSTDLIR
jgi:hypothetical protein